VCSVCPQLSLLLHTQRVLAALLTVHFSSSLCVGALQFPAAERAARAMCACMKSIFRTTVLSSAVRCMRCTRCAENVSVADRRSAIAALQRYGVAAAESAMLRKLFLMVVFAGTDVKLVGLLLL
jgi:hypothetical protein